MPTLNCKSIMTLFEVSINGNKKTRAGVKRDGVISVILSFRRKGKEENIEMSVTGLESKPGNIREHLKWVSKSLSIGDEVTVRISEANACDRPQSRIKESNRRSK